MLLAPLKKRKLSSRTLHVIWPRLLLGGLFGFLLPWLLGSVSTELFATGKPAASIAAFFGGYSVRFSTGFIERVMWAVFPDAKPAT